MSVLMNYDYPGNVRELENTIEHACVLCPMGNILLNHLPNYIPGTGPGPSPSEADRRVPQSESGLTIGRPHYQFLDNRPPFIHKLKSL